MNANKRALEIYQQHIGLATTNGRSFRKTVMDQIMAETGCSLAAAATHYNNAKNANPVAGLGRAPVSKNIRKPGASKSKAKEVVPDDECYSVLELIKNEGAVCVGRCQSFEFQGEAGEKFDEKVAAWPNSTWVVIRGLGPNSGDNYKLSAGEKELKRYEAKVDKVAVTC